MNQITACAHYEPQTTREEMERKYYYHVWDVMREPNPIPWLRLGKLYYISQIGSENSTRHGNVESGEESTH